MTLVDTSVWIDFLRGTATAEVAKLQTLLRRGEVFVGDLIVAEVLQGARGPKEVRRIESIFAFLPSEPLVGDGVARQSAANYRLLRSNGVTIRKTIDMLIGTWCIREQVPLLHADRDFDPMEAHLGLIVASA